MGDDDKSWREIDRERDKSDHVSDDESNRRDKRADSKYKQDLEKLFRSGDHVPDRFEEEMEDLGPEEGTEEAARKEEIEALREADGFRAFAKAVNVYVQKGYELPDDEDLLIRMLDHPDDGIVRSVLEHLVDLSERREIMRKEPIRSRLSTIRTMSSDAETLDLVEQLEGDVLD